MKRILVIGGKGYIGSRLVPHLEEAGHYVCIVDLVDGLDYTELISLAGFDSIVLLAAHSSVAMCQADTYGSWLNNVANFQGLINKLGNQKFIYASSASVYSGLGRKADEQDNLFPPEFHYDMHKQQIDTIAKLSGKNYYGLRFGTVCGLSSNPRLELVVNSMFVDAATKGAITVSNGSNMRAVLALADLCRAIQAIVEKDDSVPGFYNLCSFNMSIGEIADRIVRSMKSELTQEEGVNTYSFAMDTSKFEQAFNFQFEANLYSIINELKGLQVWDKSAYNRNNRVEYPRCTKKSESA